MLGSEHLSHCRCSLQVYAAPFHFHQATYSLLLSILVCPHFAPFLLGQVFGSSLQSVLEPYNEQGVELEGSPCTQCACTTKLVHSWILWSRSGHHKLFFLNHSLHVILIFHFAVTFWPDFFRFWVFLDLAGFFVLVDFFFVVVLYFCSLLGCPFFHIFFHCLSP